jgi:hypothetical protein
MNSRILLAGGAIAAAAGTWGCARTTAELSPAPDAMLISGGIGQGATATVAGVQVVARTRAWHWDPTNLDTKVTPILLELQNTGDRAVSVRYNHISLGDDAGNRFNVMPPYDIDATLSESYTIRNPYYGFNRFAVAPYLSRWYPRFDRYDGAFAYDPGYYRPYVTEYARVALPTADMVQRALPEGVISAGGRAEGFVYFEAFHRGAKMLTLHVDIVDAVSGALLGTAQIPFVTT